MYRNNIRRGLLAAVIALPMIVVAAPGGGPPTGSPGASRDASGAPNTRMDRAREEQRDAMDRAREARRDADNRDREERRDTEERNREDRRDAEERAREARQDAEERTREDRARAEDAGRDRDEMPPGLADNPKAQEKVREAQSKGDQGESREKGNRPWWQFWGD